MKKKTRFNYKVFFIALGSTIYGGFVGNISNTYFRPIQACMTDDWLTEKAKNMLRETADRAIAEYASKERMACIDGCFQDKFIRMVGVTQECLNKCPRKNWLK